MQSTIFPLPQKSIKEIEYWEFAIRQTFTKSIAKGFSTPEAMWKGFWVYQDCALEFKLLDWQLADIYSFFFYGTVLFNYCRDAGKSMIGSHLAVFVKIIGYGTMWFSGQTAQLMAVFHHWNKNPFVVPFKPSKQRQSIDIYCCGMIETRCLTVGNVRGPHVPFVFYDEVSLMDENIWRASLPIAAEFTPNWRCYFSTPVLHSLFHKLSKIFPIFTHTYLECPFLNHPDIESQRPLMNDAFWKQEYLAIFCVLEGKVFHNIQIFKGQPPDCVRIRQGVDLHGRKPQIMVRVGEFGGKLWFLGEYSFVPDNKKDQAELTRMHLKFPTEVEDNDEGSEYLFLLPTASRLRWDATTKYEQIGYMIRTPLMINAEITPECWAEFDAAQYDDKGKVDTGDLDYCAAGIHAGGNSDMGVVDLPSQQNVFVRRTR